MEQHTLMHLHTHGSDFASWGPNSCLGSLANGGRGVVAERDLPPDREQCFHRLTNPSGITPREAVQPVHDKEHPLPGPMISRQPPAISLIHPNTLSLQPSGRSKKFIRGHGTPPQRNHRPKLTQQQSPWAALEDPCRDLSLARVKFRISDPAKRSDFKGRCPGAHRTEP
jgi:hypothetical protein